MKQDLAKELGLEVIETSAKDSSNVDQAFLKIATEALKTRFFFLFLFYFIFSY